MGAVFYNGKSDELIPWLESLQAEKRFLIGQIE